MGLAHRIALVSVDAFAAVVVWVLEAADRFRRDDA